MNCCLRMAMAFVAAIVVFCVTFYTVWMGYGAYLIKKNPHYTMAGLASAAYGIEAGFAASIVTLLLALFLGRRKRDPKQDQAAPNKDQPPS